MTNQTDVIYSWEFDDSKKRGNLWYFIAISLVISLVIWGILSKIYILSIVILLISGLYYFVENNSEDKIIVNISSLGIKVVNSFYDFSRIECFSIIYDNDKAILLRLRLKTKGLSMVDLKIDNSKVPALKEILPNFIKENPKEELTFYDKLIILLKL